MGGLTFTCPVCGCQVPRRAKSCPDCGACEKSGWSQDRYLDGVDLPGESFDYDEFATRALGGGGQKRSKTQWLWVIVAALLVIAMVWMTIRSAW